LSIGVVLLNYNRADNLRLALRALQEQSLDADAFQVVVADDGSTDGSVAFVRGLMREPRWAGRLHLASGGPHHEARISRIHNIGIANLPVECTLFVLLASDMCLAPDALEKVAEVHAQHPDAVIIARLDWLPPIPTGELASLWDAQGFAGLVARIPDQSMHLVEHTPVGYEPRIISPTPLREPLNTDIFHPVYAVPMDLYWRVGGYDENMVGYGWQELDFGLRLAALDAPMVSTQTIRALHIWHPKDPEVSALVPWQRQRNTDYMLRKHMTHPKVLDYREWHYWRHYHRRYGGQVAYVQAQGLFALNAEMTHALHLPHAGWLHPLGYSVADVALMQEDGMARVQRMGDATDPLNECDFSTLISDMESVLRQRVLGWMRASASPVAADATLASLYASYERAHHQGDNLPGAQHRVVGRLVRLLGRLAHLGRARAAERALLSALVARSREKPYPADESPDQPPVSGG
jgi:GT2 family glycosyltransferase